MSVLETLISQDYTIIGHPDNRFVKTEEHDSLVIDREKDLFFWNSREIYGTSLTWLTRVKSYSFEEAKRILKDLEHEETFVYTIKRKDKEDIIVYPKLIDVFWENGLNKRDYWYSRCLTDETINRFKLGFHNDWFMIPIYIDGTFRNFQCRKETPAKEIKSWYKGVGPLLFNSDILRITNRIFITEGLVDAILLNQFGIPAVGHNAGNVGWQREWFKYFFYQRKIYYIGDNDDAGRKGAKKVAEELGLYRTKIYTFDGMEDKMDTVEFIKQGNTIDDLKDLIYNKSYFSFERK